MSPKDTYDRLLELSTNVASALAHIENLTKLQDKSNEILERLHDDLQSIQNKIKTIDERLEHHNSQITTIQKTVNATSVWKTRLGGISVGIGMAFTTIASGIALVRTFIGH